MLKIVHKLPSNLSCSAAVNAEQCMLKLSTSPDVYTNTHTHTHTHTLLSNIMRILQ